MLFLCGVENNDIGPVAEGRARVGVAAAAADWPKRIRDLQFLDHEGYATAT